MNPDRIEEAFAPTPDGKCATARHGMVSTAFPDATKAGVAMLRKGGNAIDAACAASLALGVCEPQASGIGGQSLAILHINGTTIAVDGSSRAPLLARASAFKTPQDRCVGYKAATVPSTISMLGHISRRYGRLDWPDIVEPAIHIARRGYRITKLQHRLQQDSLEDFLKVKSRSGAAYFLKDGEVPYDAGDLFIQEDLAGLLEHLASHGYESFYHGRIADIIDADMRKHGGFVRKRDMADMPAPVERKPICRSYRGIPIRTMPPPSAGDTMLLVLMMLENLDVSFLRKETAASWHFMAETFRKALLYRTQKRFHPDTYRQTPDRTHLSRSLARSLAGSITDRMDTSLPQQGHPDTEDTTHLSVMDQDGNAIGITQSIELVYGSKAAADGLGFLYNSYISAFEFGNDMAHPFHLRPGGIPWTSVSPAIMFYDERPWIVLGSPGSSRIFSTVSHFVSRMVDGENAMDQAMLKPRLHCSVDGTASLEKDDTTVQIAGHLRELGYTMDIRQRYSFFLGAIHAVLRRRAGDGFQGVAEIRRDGTAEGPD